MNAKQRYRNRDTAATLMHKITICPECGKNGKHYIAMPYSLQDIFDRNGPQGFYTCDKFYGADGRRLEIGNQA